MISPAPPDILLRITAQRRERYGIPPGKLDLGAAPGAGAEPAVADAAANPFLAAIAAHRGRAIIAEIKLGSPRLGSLRGTFDPEAHASAYAESGAVALSVVVEPDSFFGSYDLLRRCRAASGLPAIAKDFVVTTRQLDEAKAAGADAVLLVASLYEADALRRLAQAARRLGLAPLIETHDRADVEKLEGAAWELVGVNNRDLRTFIVNLSHSISLQPHLPAGALKVAESGLRTAADLGRLRQAGFDAFLVGETLITTPDPTTKLRELLGSYANDVYHSLRYRCFRRRGRRAMRPHVKICGITRLEDADRALALGAEFIGLNFYAPSPRSIDVDRAVQLRRHVGDRGRVVGVFVNHDAAEVASIAARVGLDLLQFHGDEGPLELEPHAARAIKVFRIAGALPHDEVARYPNAWGLLFDTARSGASAAGAASFESYGGTGRPWSWDSVGSLPGGRRTFVAGGIRPDNVARLLARLSPWGIDVSSGVEAAPGRKDPALLERLFEEIAHGQIASAS